MNDPTGHWVETAFDVVSLGMTINDIKNEGFTFWNTVSLVTDVASIVLPAVPAGASHIIRAAKYANKADNIIDTTKVASNFAEFWNKAKTAVKNYCSFSEDTKVSTQEGEKEIADIEEGDYVLAWNEGTDEIGYYEVTDTFSHIDPVLTELIINGEWIETTPEHPFYTLEEGWIPADELETGMHVRQADGDYEMVWFKWNVEKDQEMYNFTVDTAHTYFVGQGQWLVHNECYKINMKLIDWSDYPINVVPKPKGQLYFLDGDTYDIARILKENANRKLKTEYPNTYGHPLNDVHEIMPVKFGGSPTDIENKIPLNRIVHQTIVSPWWRSLQHQITNNPKKFLIGY